MTRQMITETDTWAEKMAKILHNAPITHGIRARRIIKKYKNDSVKYAKYLTRWANRTENRTENIVFRVYVAALRANGAGVALETALKTIQA